MFPRVWRNEHSHYQVNSHFGLLNLHRAITGGQNPLDWGVHYINWKALETYMSKVGSHDPFGHFKHKLWPKERLGIKLTIWFPTTKSWESPDFLACMCRATYCWKGLDKGYNFALDLISIRGLHIKLWTPKVAGVPTLGISWLPFGSPRTKCNLCAGPVAWHKIYYKGEGGGFPQVRVVVSFVSRSLPVACSSTKNAPTMH
jgi:hypothetical protein